MHGGSTRALPVKLAISAVLSIFSRQRCKEYVAIEMRQHEKKEAERRPVESGDGPVGRTVGALLPIEADHT